MTYTDKQINDFLEVAQEVGITKAMRELDYPSSWSTAQRWAKNRGVEVAVDEVMAKAAATREWYKTEEVLTLAEAAFSRIYEDVTKQKVLTADEQKKLAEAGQKWFNVWSAAQGKAQAITENRQTDNMDAHLAELLNVERAKALNEKENVLDNSLANIV